MFGSKKGALRKEQYNTLLDTLNRCKNDWKAKKKVIEASIDPSDEVIHQLKLAEARYFFLLKEIRTLNITKSR
ncbi:MAG: YaaL family protein [Sporolactobacillus sp.]